MIGGPHRLINKVSDLNIRISQTSTMNRPIFLLLSLFLLVTIAKASIPCQLLPDAPSYIQITANCSIFVRFGVFITSNNSLLSIGVVKSTITMIRNQIIRDFRPYYGLNADFSFFSPQNQPSDWSQYIPIVIADYLTQKGKGYDITLAWITQDSNDVFGFDMYSLIAGPLPNNLPNGSPWISLLMGDNTTGYGLIYVLNEPPFWPDTMPVNFQSGFSYLLDYGIISILGNPTTNRYQLYHYPGSVTQDFYSMEIVQPVEFQVYTSDNHHYFVDFVLPSFWQQSASKGPFDYLNTVPSPFTPWKGHIFFERFNATGQTNQGYYNISPQNNPSNHILISIGKVLHSSPVLPHYSNGTANVYRHIVSY